MIFLRGYLDKENKKSISLVGFNDLITIRHCWTVYCKNIKFVGKSIKEYGECSPGEIELLKQILSPNDVVIEVCKKLEVIPLPC